MIDRLVISSDSSQCTGKSTLITALKKKYDFFNIQKEPIRGILKDKTKVNFADDDIKSNPAYIRANNPSGCFGLTGETVDLINSAQVGAKGQTAKFDASLSNAIYGASDTVQPPALVLLPQIRY